MTYCWHLRNAKAQGDFGKIWAIIDTTSETNASSTLHTHTKFKGKKCDCQPIPLYSIHNMDTGSSLPIQNFIPWKSGCLASIPSSVLISLSVFMAEAHFCSCTEKNKATIKYFIVWVMCKFQANGKMWILLWKKVLCLCSKLSETKMLIIFLSSVWIPLKRNLRKYS